MAPGSVVLHTEASRGFGGQEIRILAESRWLATHGWRALIAAQPGTRLLAEAERAGVATVAVRMRGPWSLLAVAALRRGVGRASCRGRGEVSGGAGSFKKKTKEETGGCGRR